MLLALFIVLIFILVVLLLIWGSIGVLMATVKEQIEASVEVLRTAVNDATNRVATKLQTLNDKIDALVADNANGLKPEDVTEIKGDIESQVTALQAIGADAANPVPETPAAPADGSTPA